MFLLALFPLLAHASADKIPLSAIFAQASHGQPLCFGREFSSSEPKRSQIKTIRAKVVSDKTDPAHPNNYLEIELSLRGEKEFYKIYRAYLPCNLATEQCTMECEGGSVRAWGQKNGALQIKNESFVIEGGCGASKKPKYLTPAPGVDDVLQLTPLPRDFCQL